MADDHDYEIGYGKPPRHTRFQPGHSGNPKGRKKKHTEAECFEALFLKSADARITVNIDGKRQKITAIEAVIRRQFNKAINGDSRAAKEVIKLHDRAEAYRRKMVKDEHQIRQERHQEMLNSFMEAFSGSMENEGKLFEDTDDAENLEGEV